MLVPKCRICDRYLSAAGAASGRGYPLPPVRSAARAGLPRWVRYMKNGVTEIPDSPLAGNSHAVNMASLLIRQKAGFKGGSIAHELRKLTGIRPWKL